MFLSQKSNKVTILLLTALLSLIMSSIGCFKSNASLTGTIQDESGNPIYGAKVEISGKTVETSQDGSFSLEEINAESKTIIVRAYGYSDYSEQVSLSAGENNIGKIILESKNSQLLSEIGNVSTYSGVKKAMEYSGFKVANDTSLSKAFADAHINGIVDLISLHKDVTIGQIAQDLAVQGVEAGGSPITPSGLVELLQALVDVGYQRPGDPRLLLPLYLVSNSDGSLPSQAPELSTSTLLDPPRATALYSALIFLAEHPISSNSINLSSSSLFKRTSSQKTRGWQEDILSSLSSSPLPPDPADYDSFIAYFGAAYAQVGGSFAGSIIGLGIGGAIAGGLTIATGGSGAVFAPFIMKGSMIAGGFLGGKLALWLYKNKWNKVGEVVSEEEAEDIVLDEDGDIGFSSDIRVILTWEGGPLTDVDLHITDPNDEECYYGNMTTSIGGELDVDDTDGYGPENFRLARGEAISGSYQIEVNYYSDEGTPGEPILATVKVYLNEGRPEEIIQEFGPHEITEADAWWIVTSLEWPSGQFTSSDLIKRSKSRTTFPPK